jgi:DNA-binding response OmpR family regulator
MAVILVVEDDADTCESLARFLAHAEYEVVCASDGRDAVAKLTEAKPDLVLLDLRLPEMDGVAFLHVVRSYLQWIELPVIVITGLDDDFVVEQTLDAGVKHVIRKGHVEFPDLLAAVNSELVPHGFQ